MSNSDSLKAQRRQRRPTPPNAASDLAALGESQEEDPKRGGARPPFRASDLTNFPTPPTPLLLRAALTLAALAEEDEDDRVFCSQCANLGSKMERQSYPIQFWEKVRYVNHKAFHWMFEDGVARHNGDWVTVHHKQSSCEANRWLVLDNISHRCDKFKPKSAITEDAEWWID